MLKKLMKAKFVGKSWKDKFEPNELVLDGTTDPFPLAENLSIKAKILIYELFHKMHANEKGIKKT